MPLTSLTLNANVGWSLSKTNTGFNPTKYGPDSRFFNLATVDTSIVNQIATKEYTSIASMATNTIDVRSLVNLVGESFTFGHVLGLMVLPVGTGSELTFGPGASNGLQWIWGTTTDTLVVPPGSGMVFTAAASSTGTATDGTHKTLDFVNSGGSTMTSLTVVIWGSTT